MAMCHSQAYDARFYAGQQDGSARSAEHVLPLVFDLVRPGSVVDLGCGTASWLATARRLGAETVLGGSTAPGCRRTLCVFHRGGAS